MEENSTYSERKQRDNDTSMLFQFKSSEEISAICRQAVLEEQAQRRIADFANAARNTLSVEKFMQSKLVNRK